MVDPIPRPVPNLYNITMKLTINTIWKDPDDGTIELRLIAESTFHKSTIEFYADADTFQDFAKDLTSFPFENKNDVIYEVGSIDHLQEDNMNEILYVSPEQALIALTKPSLTIYPEAKSKYSHGLIELCKKVGIKFMSVVEFDLEWSGSNKNSSDELDVNIKSFVDAHKLTELVDYAAKNNSHVIAFDNPIDSIPSLLPKIKDAYDSDEIESLIDLANILIYTTHDWESIKVVFRNKSTDTLIIAEYLASMLSQTKVI